MEKQTYSQAAYEAIKNSLIQGAYGKYVNGRRIATELGMGYSPVREALQRLLQEGLLERIPNSGYFVREIEWKDISRIFQVRECVELFIWDQMFDEIDESTLRRMELLHEKEIQAAAQQDFVVCREIDIEFHGILPEQYRNRDLLFLYRNCREKQMICVNQPLALYNQEAIREHGEIIGQVREGRKEAALALLRKHILNFRERMQGNIRESGMRWAEKPKNNRGGSK
ncbi:GntR family transcriptional regulator [Hominifimenecus sp. rT4P-3]|uniref:GntR family transcriptional regulator n=1 Tax=Hominifimenecus sp. rT4P-3 TaxID=3242979 RepID=UPI003DA4126A